MNDVFGFYTNKPFYIVSKLPMRRVCEVVGGRNIVIKSLNRGRLEQQFYFDGVSKTIKSIKYKDRSFNVQNNGRANNLDMQVTNSRWW
jgi:hypothetical protein